MKYICAYLAKSEHIGVADEFITLKDPDFTQFFIKLDSQVD